MENYSYKLGWLTILEMVGDHSTVGLCLTIINMIGVDSRDGECASRGRWVTILWMVGDHPGDGG